MKRELGSLDIQEQAEALRGYLSKRDNRGAAFWIKGIPAEGSGGDPRGAE